MTEHGIVPPETPMLRRRRWRLRVTLVALAVVLVAGGVWGVVTVGDSCGSLSSGVRDIDGVCVGVNDGSYVFHPELADVQGRIAAENARVRADPRGYVSVALLDPLTPTDDSALPPSSVRNRLEGAYTALRRVNTSNVAEDTNPQIQLLLANQGSTDDQWRHVLARLRELSAAEEHPLLGVVGLGVSTARTRQQAEDLSDAGIPMVGAVLAADDLEYDAVPGLIKTSPSNRHYVAALRDYLDSTGVGSAIMVRDSNSDKGVDLYTKSLENAFEEQMADILTYETQQFTGKSAAAPGSPPSLFGTVRANICSVADDTGLAILYAGREIDLGDLLGSLATRPCQDAPLTVLTAGLELGKVLAEVDLRAAKLTVLNAATVDPIGWNRGEPGTPTYYSAFRKAFVDVERFPSSHLLDGGAIMTHDALLTASQAIRMAAPLGSASRLSTGLVYNELLNMNIVRFVQGASGRLEFSDGRNGGGAGVPKGKPIPVLRYPHPTDDELPSQRVGRLCQVVAEPVLITCGGGER